jgi:hypothetical protein
MRVHAEPASGPPPAPPTDASIGRAAVKGALVGYFVVLTIIGSIVFATGAGFRTALAVGAFAGMWGGPGWGGMMAAQVQADRLAAEERNAPGGGSR